MTAKSGKNDTDWLVEQARNGNAEARKDLMERHRSRLRQFAWDCLLHLHRRHLTARRRSVTREEASTPGLSSESVLKLSQRLMARGSSPSNHLIRQELRDRLQAALAKLSPNDREILVMRNLEQMPAAEIAAVLGIKEGTVRVRHLRALERLRALLDLEGEEP